MRRRQFLSLLGAAGMAPALPMPAARAAAVGAAGYNRYMYGLAVFHAHTRASISAVDLAGKLKVSLGTAEAMLGEMTAKGVVGPILNSSAMRAISRTSVGPHVVSVPKPSDLGAAPKDLLNRVAAQLESDAVAPDADDDVPPAISPDAAPDADTVQDRNAAP
ncbi:hypothetical protein E4Z66_14215 [Aliishimia ponticola]|uniref:MarR family transcriptional regulator n=1 Tax=Aliishimia ponticola TaxID=2499833 RepID=A0A4S4NJC2_9RHOB|nr:hypothetical protein [Aliishimia ponticola]THH36200.1 hypothetical protein E4Z66_14215 [Aliishimia ponticola]